MTKEPVKLSENEIKCVESILTKGYRVELIPVKGGVKVLRVRLDEVKTNK